MPKDNPGWWSRNVTRVARPEEQSAEQAKRAPRVLLAFLALIVIVAVGVWALRVFWFEPSQTADPDPQPSSSSAPAETTEPTAPDETCTLDNTDRDISTTPPEAAQWIVERWAVLPVVEGAGPCVERSGYRVGFAHTQTGAVLAVYHYFVHGVPTTADDGTRGMLEHGLVDGTLKDSLLQQVDDVENGVELRVPDSDYNGVRLSGYRIQDFTGDTAVVEVLYRTETAAASLTAQLVWQDGDWRIDPTSANAWGAVQSNVRVQDFVAWSPEVEG